MWPAIHKQAAFVKKELRTLGNIDGTDSENQDIGKNLRNENGTARRRTYRPPNPGAMRRCRQIYRMGVSLRLVGYCRIRVQQARLKPRKTADLRFHYGP